MRPPILLSVLALCTACSAPTGDILTPEPLRITEQAISSDLAVIEGLQERLEQLNNQGVSIGSYHFAKAQAWVDFARDEYRENDRSSVIEEALMQALPIIELLESGSSDLSMDTPVISSSKEVRSDLWALADTLKNHQGFECAEDKVAQLEVQLVWAGHESAQMGWRHSKPYLQAAERFAREAQTLATGCAPAVMIARAPAEPPQPAPEVQVVAAAPKPKVPTRVHFGYDSTEISEQTAALLQRVALVMMVNPQIRLDLVGHADARDPQRSDYNFRIASERVLSVHDYLVEAGIDAARLTHRSAAINKPLKDGRTLTSLARNRSVELVWLVPAEEAAGFELQFIESDLQPEADQ